MRGARQDRFEIRRRRWLTGAYLAYWIYPAAAAVACAWSSWAGFFVVPLGVAWGVLLFGGSENDRPWRAGWRDLRQREAELQAWLDSGQTEG